ncbi:hypothetical protein Psed_6633 [Pseudonocardia dioxanivorans CB1190]|uniref:Uncharacterized protein n=2 Tax=Pseudonocardia TaxID=1847 RepID=F4CXR5_PSEUX|nr:hypothetical protein [Pseudonocardia dioxanivorans]AEA28721.1 hypothetical protein Psed_6633 [Pseudonocardia dioxanivorans CB1190]
MPDRYADAVRMARAELRARRLALPGHAAEVRAACSLARVAAAARSATAVAALSAELFGYLDRAGRADRALLPRHAAAAAERIVADVLDRAGQGLVPELRRIASARGLPTSAGEGWVPGPVHILIPPAPPPPGLWQTAATGGALWRTALLPLAGLPVVGLPAVAGGAGSPAVWAGAAAGVVTLVAAVLGRRGAADRERWRRWVPGVTASLRAALESALLTALLHTERQVVAALDPAVVRRAGEIDAQLRGLTGPPGERAAPAREEQHT